jgi:hypothetical protein
MSEALFSLLVHLCCKQVLLTQFDWEILNPDLVIQQGPTQIYKIEINKYNTVQLTNEFESNWIAKLSIPWSALFVKFISIKMRPVRRTQRPSIWSPFPFVASSHIFEGICIVNWGYMR